jgi:hypothetical protein
MPVLTDPTAHSDLMARALAYLNRTFLGGCTHSCERAAYCLASLARTEGLEAPVRQACAGLSETLWAWSTMRPEERAECAPWLAALPTRNPGSVA